MTLFIKAFSPQRPLLLLTMCSRVLLSRREPTMPTTETVNITSPRRISTTAGARNRPSRVRFFCLSTSAYTPTQSTQSPTSCGEIQQVHKVSTVPLKSRVWRNMLGGLVKETVQRSVFCHVWGAFVRIDA